MYLRHCRAGCSTVTRRGWDGAACEARAVSSTRRSRGRGARYTAACNPSLGARDGRLAVCPCLDETPWAARLFREEFSRASRGTRLAVPGRRPRTFRPEVLVRRSALLAFVVAAATVPLLAQSPVQDLQASQPPPVFRSQASLVSLNVSVLDSAARYVTGLQPADFAVYEDGVRQDVRFFESNAVPIDLIVLVDTSASMSNKMDAVHQAALGFLRTLRDGDRGAVVAFSDTVTILQPLTGDRVALDKAVESTHAHGATAL